MSGLIARYLLAVIVLRLAAVPFTPEEIALAQIVQGEANHQFMGDQGAAAYGVGWVARNRLEAGYGESYADLQKDFNGTIVQHPKWRYLAIARLVINGQRDPTAGSLYVLSQQDVERLGFDVEEATLALRASPYRALYFFEEWQSDDLAGDPHASP